MTAHPAWEMIGDLPVVLSVAVPLRAFRMRDLLSLQPNQTIRTVQGTSRDIPLAIGALQLAHGEFDVLKGNIAVRLTRLA